MSTQVLTAEIRARDRASRDIKKVEGRMGRLSKVAKRVHSSFGAASIAMAGFVAITAKAVRLAGEQETVNKRLRLAISRVGGSYDDAADGIRAFQEEMQATTKFGDDEMAKVLTTLTSLTGSFGKETFDAARTVADLSEGAMVPMASSMRLVAQAIAGNISALTRYIPALKGVDAETFALKNITERTAFITEALGSAFGGSAKEISKSEQGLANLKNTSGDVLEAFGKMIISLGSIAGNAQTVISALQGLERHFNVTEKGVKKFIADEDADGLIVGALKFVSGVSLLEGAVGLVVEQTDFADAALKRFGERLNAGQVSSKEFTDTLKRLKSAGVDVGHEFGTKLTVFADAYAKAANKAADATKLLTAEQKELARVDRVASQALIEITSELEAEAKAREASAKAAAKQAQALARVSAELKKQFDLSLKLGLLDLERGGMAGGGITDAERAAAAGAESTRDLFARLGNVPRLQGPSLGQSIGGGPQISGGGLSLAPDLAGEAMLASMPSDDAFERLTETELALQTFTDNTAANLDRLVEASARMSSQVSSDLDSIIPSAEDFGSALGGAIANVVNGQQGFGAAMRNMAASVLTNIGIQASGKAVFYLAEGIAAATNPFTAFMAPGYFKAAGLMAGLAIGGIGGGALAGAGGGGGGGGKRGGRRNDPASSFSAAGETASVRDLGPRQTTLVLSFSGERLHTDEDIGRRVDEVLTRHAASA